MTELHLIADLITRQAEATALRLEDRIAAKKILTESVRRASADYADLICRLIEEDAAEDAKLAALIRAGEPVLPPAATLTEPQVNTEAVADPVRLAAVPEPPNAPAEDPESGEGEDSQRKAA